MPPLAAAHLGHVLQCDCLWDDARPERNVDMAALPVQHLEGQAVARLPVAWRHHLLGLGVQAQLELAQQPPKAGGVPRRAVRQHAAPTGVHGVVGAAQPVGRVPLQLIEDLEGRKSGWLSDGVRTEMMRPNTGIGISAHQISNWTF